MEKLVRKLKSGKVRDILRVQTEALKAIHDFMEKKGVLQIMPVMLSPFTDPLAHPTFDSKVKYLGQDLELTKSMIMHKAIALIGGLGGVYVASPNIRLESSELKESGRHLIEFSQLDIEFEGMGKKEFMCFTEKLVCFVIGKVKERCEKELGRLGRSIEVPEKPFKKFESKDLKKLFGEDFEKILSQKEKQPFWILDHEREFYDKEDSRGGYHHNYDLVWPEGFGEALSGGEREFEYKAIVRKMKERGMDMKPYQPFLEVAKKGLLRPSSGGGLGIERLVRFLCGAKHIKDVCLFPRVAGEKVLL